MRFAPGRAFKSFYPGILVLGAVSLSACEVPHDGASLNRFLGLEESKPSVVSATPTPSASATPAVSPSATPAPTATPVATASPSASVSPTPIPSKRLNASWNPQAASLDAYYSFNGTPTTSIANLGLLNSVVGPQATFHNDSLLQTTYPASGYVSAPAGSGIVLDGTGSEYITLDMASTSFSYPAAQSFSILTWVKWTANDSWQRIISNGFNNFYNGWSLLVSPNYGGAQNYPGSFAFGMGSFTGNASDAIGAITTNAYNNNQWHQVALVFDQTAKKMNVYVDGLNATIAQMPGTCGSLNGTTIEYTGCSQVTASNGAIPTIAGWSGGGWSGINGSLAEIAIFKSALSASDVATIYNRQK